MSLGSKPAQYQPYIPPDVQGIRSQQINLLQSLLGGSQSLESVFGSLGSPTSGLQRQSMGGISQYLNQPAPEQRAFDMSQGALQGILGGKPGQGVMDALQPMFDRNLAQADQQGGRFGSGNAIMRSNALNDFNLLGAQAAQHGQDTQLQAAQILGMLGGQAGQNPFSRMMGAYGVGANDAQQGDLETQRRLQLMSMLFGGAQGVAFNNPIVQTQGASPGLGGVLGGLLGTGLGAFAGGAGSAAGGAVGKQIGGWFGGGG